MTNENEYNLVGKELYPILYASDGETIIDGNHRLKANKKWKKEVTDISPNGSEYYASKMISNGARRDLEEGERKQDVNNLAESLVKEGVQPGRISGAIRQLTGFTQAYIIRHLFDQFKIDTKPISEQVSAPSDQSEVQIEAKKLQKQIDQSRQKSRHSHKTFVEGCEKCRKKVEDNTRKNAKLEEEAERKAESKRLEDLLQSPINQATAVDMIENMTKSEKPEKSERVKSQRPEKQERKPEPSSEELKDFLSTYTKLLKEATNLKGISQEKNALIDNLQSHKTVIGLRGIGLSHPDHPEAELMWVWKSGKQALSETLKAVKDRLDRLS